MRTRWSKNEHQIVWDEVEEILNEPATVSRSRGKKVTPDKWADTQEEQIPMEGIQRMDSESPITYIGSKKNLYTIVMELLPKGTKELVSPFMGGCSLELLLAASGIKVYAYDIFQEIVEFFQVFNGQSDDVVDATLDIYPISDEQIRALHESHEAWLEIPTAIERAAATWCVNKQTFMAKGYSSAKPQNKEFWLSRDFFKSEKWHQWFNPFIEFEVLPFELSLEEHDTKIAYLDPPYVEMHRIYGRGDQGEFPHDELFTLLDARQRFIMSYGEHELIRELYKDYKIIAPQWKYGYGEASIDEKKSKEILILSHDIAKEIDL